VGFNSAFQVLNLNTSLPRMELTYDSTEFPPFVHHGSASTQARRYITNKDRAKLQQYITRNLEISREICHCLWSEILREEGPSTRPVHLRHLTAANDKAAVDTDALSPAL